MSKKKIVNLGKVRARTKELRLNGTVIEHKYDDEQNWQPLVDLGEAGSSIDTVSAHSELPSDARENDVAIVEEEEYVRTENKTTVLSIEVKLPAEDQYIPNIYNINFRDSFNSILNNEEVKSLGSALNIMLETETHSIMYVDIGAEIAPMMAGTDHPAQIVAVMNGEENMNFYVSGISIRDFLQLMMELELEEEQWAILLGSHANDNSADSPSYGWVNMVMSTESINDNSLGMDGFYATLLFDSEAPKITDILSYASVGIMTTSGENIEASTSLYSTYDSSSDVDPEEQAFVLKFVNLALNNIAHGGIIEQSNDIYNPKGLFQNDNGEWVSLEEKMNTPRFVDTYFDLPKTSIENGIMAVVKESVYKSEPTETTVLETYKSYRLKSIDDITSETINSIIETLLPSYPTNASAMTYLYLMDMNANNEMYCSIVKNIIDENNTVAGITFSYEINDNIARQMVCFTEIPFGTRVEDMELFPPAQGSDTYPDITLEAGKWYWGDVYDDGKSEYYTVDGVVHEGFSVNEFPDNVLFGGGYIEFDNSVYPAAVETYDSSDNYKEFATLDTIAFHFDDLNSIYTITYPAGFYRYNNNEWKHIEDVSGGNFENEDVLRSITATDVGNIQENTEKRHEHSNKSYLDQIQWDTVSNVNQNTSARHTHNNKDYIDQIDNADIQNINEIPNIKSSVNNLQNRYLSLNSSSHSHSNKEVLDAIIQENLHIHTNKDILDSITSIPLILTSNDVTVDLGAERCDEWNTLQDKTYIVKPYWMEGYRSLKIYSTSPEILYPYSTYESGAIQNSVIFKCYENRPISIGGFYSKFIKFYPGYTYKITNHAHYVWSEIQAMYYLTNDKEVECIGTSELNEPEYLDGQYNYKYAKMVDGQVEYAPSKFYIDGYYVYNQPKPYYLEQGYKEVIGDAYPFDKNACMNIEYFEDDDFIMRMVIDIPPTACCNKLNITEDTDVAYLFFFRGSELEDLMKSGIDTGGFKTLNKLFYFCDYSGRLGYINTSSAVSCVEMFKNSKFTAIPELNLCNCQNATELFANCSDLVTIDKIKFSHMYASGIKEIFEFCPKLETVSVEGTIKVDCNYSLYRWNQPYNLTSDSLMSFINAFEDNTEEETQYTVTIGSINLAKLSAEQIAVATNKNILLA